MYPRIKLLHWVYLLSVLTVTAVLDLLLDEWMEHFARVWIMAVGGIFALPDDYVRCSHLPTLALYYLIWSGIYIP